MPLKTRSAWSQADRPLCGSAGELKLQFTVVAVWGSVLCDIGGIEVREQTGVTSYLLYM